MSLNTVSYTHLDVYKRQQLGIAQGQAVKVYASASKKAKLLYTTEEGYDASFILQKKIKNKDVYKRQIHIS